MADDDLRQYVSERLATRNENERARLVSRDLSILRTYINASDAALSEAEAIELTVEQLGAFVSSGMVRDATQKYRVAHKEDWVQRQANAAGRVDHEAREVLMGLVTFSGWALDGKHVETFEDALRLARLINNGLPVTSSPSGIPPSDAPAEAIRG